MNISNKKLIKSYRDILSASNNAKAIINAEIEKVDEKYKKLAEQEKTDLVKQVKTLEAQISLYSTLLAEDEPKPEVVEEPVVVDTIFPENNEEASDEEVPAEDNTEEEGPKDGFQEIQEEEWPDEEEESNDESEDEASDNDGFPEFPQEW